MRLLGKNEHCMNFACFVIVYQTCTYLSVLLFVKHDACSHGVVVVGFCAECCCGGSSVGGEVADPKRGHSKPNPCVY